MTDRYELLEKGGSNYGLSCCPVDQVFKKSTNTVGGKLAMEEFIRFSEDNFGLRFGLN